ncbi:MAG: sugar phosphate isomerase/epimerase [Gemmataceae bacterium]|nr:sugar phosphate isomerase/epimerase [Gemmataceae bacterium]
MHVSVLLSSLPLSFEDAVRQAAAIGFSHVDIVALAERPANHAEVLADTGVLVSCAAVGRGLPDGHTLDAVSVDVRRAALDEMKRQVADAARLGATYCYIVSGMDGSAAGLTRFGEACGLLADYAQQRFVRLCVEHIPGRALATAAATLNWLNEQRHDNLSLLLDVGHCLITGEDAAAMVTQAGKRLGYVHFDDNDGVGDLHWPLLTGRLTEQALKDVLIALRNANYRGALTLELNVKNKEPVEDLRQGKALLEIGGV